MRDRKIPISHTFALVVTAMPIPVRAVLIRVESDPYLFLAIPFQATSIP